MPIALPADGMIRILVPEERSSEGTAAGSAVGAKAVKPSAEPKTGVSTNIKNK